MEPLVIAVDFDGTIVTSQYPRVGELVPGAKETINALVEAGHKLFLWTVREDRGRNMTLSDAVMFLEDEGIKIKKYNRSPVQVSSSPKQFAHFYIDDAAVGVPITQYNGHRVVDWIALAYMFASMGVISKDAYDKIIGGDN